MVLPLLVFVRRCLLYSHPFPCVVFLVLFVCTPFTVCVLGIDTVLADCCGFTKRLREKWRRQKNPRELAPEDFVDCVIFHEIFWCSHYKQPTRYQSLLWHNCNHGDKLIYAHYDSNYDITVTMVTNSFLFYSGSFLETIFSKLTGGFRYCRRCIEETLSTLFITCLTCLY